MNDTIQLQDIAKVIRSKNAGPRCTTIDIMFKDDADYGRVAKSRAITAELVASLYDVPTSDVRIIEYPIAHALKITFTRKITAGNPGDRDVYGAQQHAPMLTVNV